MSVLVQFPPAVYRRYSAQAFVGFTPTSTFKIEIARAMMWLAQLSYEVKHMKSTVALVQQLWGFDRITPFESQDPGKYDTCGVVAEGHGAMVLAFAGTDPLVWATVKTDLKFPPNKDDVHTGFAKAAAAVAGTIDDAVKTAKQKGLKLFITGHSLGGAISARAAVQARAAGYPPMAIYTFGMPRTGGDKFGTDYDKDLGTVTYRLVNGIDAVPTVPLTRMGFRHVGHLLWRDPQQTFASATLLPTGSDKPEFVSGLFESAWTWARGVVVGKFLQAKGPGPVGWTFEFLPPDIREHLQDRYFNALGVTITF